MVLYGFEIPITPIDTYPKIVYNHNSVLKRRMNQSKGNDTTMAKAIKTPKQPKEPVRVRYKTLSDGSQSVYLDIYRDGKRQYEFLKLYLHPGDECGSQGAE